ncbi:hypothetical protein FB451DRAFT_1359962 [Mycena latifolia]|nr:hypothetical protein FB451DRAFT_1359962 [Mycena latifolia]
MVDRGYALKEVSIFHLFFSARLFMKRGSIWIHFVFEERSTKLAALQFSEAEWKRVELFLHLLAYAEESQHKFASDCKATLHLALPALERLHADWTKCAADPGYSDFAAALEQAQEEVVEYCQKTSNSKAYMFGMDKFIYSCWIPCRNVDTSERIDQLGCRELWISQPRSRIDILEQLQAIEVCPGFPGVWNCGYKFFMLVGVLSEGGRAGEERGLLFSPWYLLANLFWCGGIRRARVRQFREFIRFILGIFQTASAAPTCRKSSESGAKTLQTPGNCRVFRVRGKQIKTTYLHHQNFANCRDESIVANLKRQVFDQCWPNERGQMDQALSHEVYWSGRRFRNESLYTGLKTPSEHLAHLEAATGRYSREMRLYGYMQAGGATLLNFGEDLGSNLPASSVLIGKDSLNALYGNLLPASIFWHDDPDDKGPLPPAPTSPRPEGRGYREQKKTRNMMQRFVRVAVRPRHPRVAATQVSSPPTAYEIGIAAGKQQLASETASAYIGKVEAAANSFLTAFRKEARWDEAVYGRLELQSKISIYLDAWTARNGYAFIASVAHYVTNDGKLGAAY